MCLNMTCRETSAGCGCSAVRTGAAGRVVRAGVLMLVAHAAVSARGDDIVAGGTSFARVRIVGLTDGALDFRIPEGQMRSIPLVDVDLLQVDRGASFADFNQAERMQAEGSAEQSLARYRRAMRITEGFWSEVVPVRFSRAADVAGDIETATDMLLRVMQGRETGPATAIHMLPRNIPDRRNGRVAAALDGLSACLARNPDSASRTVCTVLRDRILRRIGAEASVADARRITELVIPTSVGTVEVYAAVVEAFSFLLGAEAFESEDFAALDRAIFDCPDDMLPDFLLLKGAASQVRAQSREDWIRVSWPYLQVAIQFPEDARAGKGYYGAATALERAGLKDDARSLLHKCLEVEPRGSALSRAARSFLDRMNETHEQDNE